MYNRWVLGWYIIGLFFLSNSMSDSISYAGTSDTVNYPKVEWIERLEQLPVEMQYEILTRSLFSIKDKILLPAMREKLGRKIKGGDKLLHKHTQGVMSLAFSLDGKKLVSGSRDGTIKIWNVESKKEEKMLWSQGLQGNFVALSPDGKTVASGLGDGKIGLWNIAFGKFEKTLVGHKEMVRSVAFSPDGHTLVSSSLDGTLRLWDVKAAEEKKMFRHGNRVKSVAFTLSGNILAIGRDGDRVHFWNGNEERGKTLKGKCYVTSAAVSPDGKMLILGSLGNTIKVWDIEHEKLKNIFPTHRPGISLLAFSPNGKIFAAVSTKVFLSGTGIVDEQSVIDLWDVENGKIHAMLSNESTKIESIAFSPDGSKLAAGYADGTISLWEWRDLCDADVLEILDHAQRYLSPAQLVLLHVLNDLTEPKRPTQPIHLNELDNYFEEKYGPDRSELLHLKKSYESLPEKLKQPVRECFHLCVP